MFPVPASSGQRGYTIRWSSFRHNQSINAGPQTIALSGESASSLDGKAAAAAAAAEPATIDIRGERRKHSLWRSSFHFLTTTLSAGDGRTPPPPFLRLSTLHIYPLRGR